jgi:hypothetical protein
MRGHRVIAILVGVASAVTWQPATGDDATDRSVIILQAPVPSPLEQLAAQEVRRYVYQRTAQVLDIEKADQATVGNGNAILIGKKTLSMLDSFVSDPTLREQIDGLRQEEYILRTIETDGRKIVLLIGGDDVATLYAGYRFAEQLGVRFYLHGDVIPDERVALELPVLHELDKPLFKVRGIQPFHDFPEGPDWWNPDAYRAVLAQLPKLRMNFFGLHTYPEGGVGPEPTVWIGPKEAVRSNGEVTASYPSRHFETRNVTGAWGYEPTRTSEYSFGASALFSRDNFGADYMRDTYPWNEMDADSCNQLFNRFGDVLQGSFTFARRLGIKTCVGTECPLVIPKQVRDRLVAAGSDPEDPGTIQALYEGIFRRIQAAYPIDYYWFWTPESWTWSDVSQDQIDATIADLQLAQKAAVAERVPFQLATCGWVLGPPQSPAMFDEVLPKSWPLSCINRNVGHDPVEPGFQDISDRPQWAIPWLEDDPAMIIPQLWVGRMRKDAADALRYGCDGLLGIHWRTRILGPNVAALAQAAWSQETWKTGQVDEDPPQLTGSFEDRRTDYPTWREAPCADFYRDWAQSQFGPRAAARAAEIFSRLDGDLPRPSTWVDGPGGLVPDPRPRQQIAQDYAFVDALAELEPYVQGPGYQERFHYWLANFRYLAMVGKLNGTWAELNQKLDEMQQAASNTDKAEIARRSVLPYRRRLIRELTYVQNYLFEQRDYFGWHGHDCQLAATRDSHVATAIGRGTL